MQGLAEVSGEIVKRLRVNERIIAREVRLVGEKGEQLGTMTLRQALETSKKLGFDLVEVAPTAAPPVCRLLDYGKYKYEQDKKEREVKKGQKASLLREVRLRPSIGNHDFEAKIRLIKKLLDEGDRVKVAIRFRGREITHPDIGWKLLQRVVELLPGVASVARQPTMVEKNMTVILSSAAPKTKTVEGVKGS
jgi:translation initiation factor IF-3